MWFVHSEVSLLLLALREIECPHFFCWSPSTIVDHWYPRIWQIFAAGSVVCNRIFIWWFLGVEGVKNSFICTGTCTCNLTVDGTKCISRRVTVRKTFSCISTWIKMLEIYRSIHINYLNCLFGKFYQVIMINVASLFQDEFTTGEDPVWSSVVPLCGVWDVSQCWPYLYDQAINFSGINDGKMVWKSILSKKWAAVFLTKIFDLVVVCTCKCTWTFCILIKWHEL